MRGRGSLVRPTRRVLNDILRARLFLPPSYDFAPPPSHLPSVSSTDDTQEDGKDRQFVDGIWGEGGWARSRIIRPQECLALYKSLSTLWSHIY
jgi:hypothetical protein